MQGATGRYCEAPRIGRHQYHCWVPLCGWKGVTTLGDWTYKVPLLGAIAKCDCSWGAIAGRSWRFLTPKNRGKWRLCSSHFSRAFGFIVGEVIRWGLEEIGAKFEAGFGARWGNVLEIFGNQKWGESGLVFPAFFGSLFESVGEFYVFVKRVGQGGNSMA